MKNAFSLILVLSTISFYSYSAEDVNSGCGVKVVSGVTKQLQLGSEGGCYYVNDSGNKSYVGRSECKCN